MFLAQPPDCRDSQPDVLMGPFWESTMELYHPGGGKICTTFG
jgi:hypothetical protein